MTLPSPPTRGLNPLCVLHESSVCAADGYCNYDVDSLDKKRQCKMALQKVRGPGGGAVCRTGRRCAAALAVHHLCGAVLLFNLRSGRVLVIGACPGAEHDGPGACACCQLIPTCLPTRALQELGLPVNADIPMMGFIGRLGEHPNGVGNAKCLQCDAATQRWKPAARPMLLGWQAPLCML